MGAAALLLLCAFLSLCSGSCVSNLRSALEEGCEGPFERPAEPPGASYKPIPVLALVPSNPQGAGNPLALPGYQRTSERETAGFNLTTFTGQLPWAAGSSSGSCPVLILVFILSILLKYHCHNAIF